MAAELINPKPIWLKTHIAAFIKMCIKCRSIHMSHEESFADKNLHFRLLRLMFNETPAPAPHQIMQLRSRAALFLPHSPATFCAVDWQLISILPPG